MRNQILHILHIFRKDVRQHWPEIGASIAILGAYAWHESTRPTGLDYPVGWNFFLHWLPRLLALAWGFLIVRVVQGERLVGDRQFWVTRPYEWKRLLAAKMLCVLIFVNIPLLLAQSFLLTKAGFAPSSHLLGLLWLQLLWILILNLPVVTLATVTASIGQFILAVLCVLLYLLGGAALDSVIPSSGVAPDSLLDSVEPALVVATALAVIVWQYSRRRTGQSRFALIGVAAAVLSTLVLTPFRALIDRTYPQATPGRPLPIHLAFDPAKPTSRGGGFPEKGKVHVRIPMLVSGNASGPMVQINGTRVSVGLSGGRQWVSNWRSDGTTLYPGRPHSDINLTIDRDFFEQVKAAPATVHITFALTLYEGKGATRVVAEAGGFAVPGEGRCSIAPTGEVWCDFPLKRPFSLVSLRADEVTCPSLTGDTAPPTDAVDYKVIWNQDSDPAEFGLDPVDTQRLYLSARREGMSRSVCPGTPLTFTTLHVAQRFRSELEIDGIRLVDYQLTDSLGEIGGFRVTVP